MSEASPLLSPQPGVPEHGSNYLPTILSQPFQHSKSILSIASLALFFVVPIWALVLPTAPTTGLFAYHPPLQSLSILLFSFGILILQPITKDPKQKEFGMWTHMVIQGLAGISLIVGTYMMWENKERHGAAHITSWHATFGVTAFLILLIQLVFGAAAAFGPLLIPSQTLRIKSLYKHHRAAVYFTILPLVLVTVLCATTSATYIVNTWTVGQRVIVSAGLIAGVAGIWSRVQTSKMNFF